MVGKEFGVEVFGDWGEGRGEGGVGIGMFVCCGRLLGWMREHRRGGG